MSKEKVDAIQRMVFVLLLLVALVAALLDTSRFSPIVRTGPLVVGLPLLLLVCLLVIREVRYLRNILSRPRTVMEAIPPAPGHPDSVSEPIGFLWLGILFFGVLLFGFVIGTLAFLFLFLKIQGKESWIMVLVMVAASYAFFHIGAIHVLGMTLYRGLIPIPSPI